jgi:hypothetical protein
MEIERFSTAPWNLDLANRHLSQSPLLGKNSSDVPHTARFIGKPGFRCFCCARIYLGTGGMQAPADRFFRPTPNLAPWRGNA